MSHAIAAPLSQPHQRLANRYNTAQSIPEVWAIAAQQFADVVALHDPHTKPEVKLTYAEAHQQMQQFAAGLQALEMQPGEHMVLFADNSPRWMIADQGMMLAGVVDVVRGAQADAQELQYILTHSDSVALVVQDRATLQKLGDLALRFVILLSDETVPDSDLKLLNFSQVLALGKDRSLQPVEGIDRQTPATLMYTSGTSGMPRGVVLTHGNLIAEINLALTVVQVEPGERILSILPIWHSYERTFEYFVFAQGCTQIYTSIRHVKNDLKQFKPYYMVAVPRLWESIYEGIQKQFREQPASKQRLIQFFLDRSRQYIQAKRTLQGLDLNNLKPSLAQKIIALLQLAPLWVLHRLGDRLVYQQVRTATGGNFKFIVSGGGSIAEHLEDFYEIVGIEILGGYGLTETSPITHVRRPWRNLRGGDGQPLPHTETRIVDLETRRSLPPETQGLVLIRGPQVMQGYYKDPEATRKAIDPEGWFNTGDLGWLTTQNDLIITGRAKDTIVLTNGENIEPQPIEDACLRSPYIDQIMLVGQDQKVLGALIVPNLEALQKWATTQNLVLDLPESPTSSPTANGLTLESKPVQDLFRQELNREVKNRPGYRADDRIGVFRLILEPFSIDNALLTQTLKIRRNRVMDHYQGMINEMFV
jgi:long-chain acyl-CoA synthetase